MLPPPPADELVFTLLIVGGSEFGWDPKLVYRLQNSSGYGTVGIPSFSVYFIFQYHLAVV